MTSGRLTRGRGALPLLVLAALALTVGPGGLEGQDLADYDYENLRFRGMGLEVGYLFPNNVRETYSYGARVDLGFLGPGLRIVPGVTYWSSRLVRSEVRTLEDQLEALVVRESAPGTPRPSIDLEPIEWSDVALGLDGQVVWRTPPGFLTYVGVGGAAHVMNGEGQAIDGTFVEDLLDSIRAGFNVHGGLEVPVHENVRLYSGARYEILGDLRYLELRLGVQLMRGPGGADVRGTP